MSGICDKLKPCPICGGEPEFQHFNITPNVRGRIICSCGLEIRQGAYDTEDDLRIIWNTRVNEDTRWHELFGTPERAARTLFEIKCGEKSCKGCPIAEPCAECDVMLDDGKALHDALLEWLRGDA